MVRKCRNCGANLSQYNQGLLCWPCQKKQKEQLVERIGDVPHYTADDLCFLLGYRNPESVKRLGRDHKIPGRIPEIKQHLYLREEVDRWIRGDRESPYRIREDTTQDAQITKVEDKDEIGSIEINQLDQTDQLKDKLETIKKYDGKYFEEREHYEQIKDAIIALQNEPVEERGRLLDLIEKERVILDDRELQERISTFIVAVEESAEFGLNIHSSVVDRIIHDTIRHMNKRYKRSK